jgi:lysyl-tRNA synthetase class II
VKVQVRLDKRLLEESKSVGKELDRGDIIGVAGTRDHTKAGELTLNASKCQLLSK